MNDKFFSLPDEKQYAIINAGYRVFSQNSYRKSPMSEIAAEAGISKSLLFHYFKNKKELYMFLWHKCAQISIQYLKKCGCYEKTDLFDAMYSGMKAKIRIIKSYPNIGNFVIRAYYEKNPEVCSEIQESYRKYAKMKSTGFWKNIDTDKFIDGVDGNMIYKEIYWASEGYLLEVFSKQLEYTIDVEKMEKEFEEMIKFWKKIYLKDGGANGSNKA